jgi:hypothetical protein
VSYDVAAGTHIIEFDKTWEELRDGGNDLPIPFAWFNIYPRACRCGIREHVRFGP